MRKPASSLCSVHQVDFLHCPNDAAYLAIFKFADHTQCKLRLCGNHFAQMWAVAEFVAERRDTTVVSVTADPIGNG